MVPVDDKYGLLRCDNGTDKNWSILRAGFLERTGIKLGGNQRSGKVVTNGYRTVTGSTFCCGNGPHVGNNSEFQSKQTI